MMSQDTISCHLHPRDKKWKWHFFTILECKTDLLWAEEKKNCLPLISIDAQVGCDLPRPYVISANATCNHEGSSTHTTGFDRRCTDHKMEAFSCYDPRYDYHQTCNISSTSVGNKLVDHSNVVGASHIGAAPNYIILHLTLGFNGLGKDNCFNGLRKDNCRTRRETFKFWDLVWLILEVWWYSIAIKWLMRMCY